MTENYSSYETNQIRTLLGSNHTFEVRKVTSQPGQPIFSVFLDKENIWITTESSLYPFLVGFLQCLRNLYGE